MGSDLPRPESLAAIARDPDALRNLSQVTSHSFANWDVPKSVYYGDWRFSGIDLPRERKREMRGTRAWVGVLGSGGAPRGAAGWKQGVGVR